MSVDKGKLAAWLVETVKQEIDQNGYWEEDRDHTVAMVMAILELYDIKETGQVR